MKDIRNLSKEEIIKRIRKTGEAEVFNLRCSDLSGSDLRECIIDKKTLFSKIKIKKSQLNIIIKQMFEIEE
jgi:hypothetical protein